MRTRTGAFVLLLSLAAVASASFEMALISDNAARVVHRYDIDNGVYLGSFGQNRFNGTMGAIAIDQAANAAYVVDNTVIRRFDYNTGEYTGAFDTGINPVRKISVANDGRLIVANGLVGTGPNVYVFGNSTPTSTTALNGSILVIAAVQNDNGSFTDAANEGVNSRVTGRATLAGVPSGFLSGGTNTVAAAAERGNRYSLVYSGSWSSWFVFSNMNTGGTSGSVVLPSSNPNLTVGYAITGTSWGHVDPYAIATNGTNSQLGWYDIAGSTVTTRNLPGQIQNARDIAVVVAPEPGTMIALGAGALALLRRRKRT